jgi:DNA-binding response OmpR family regulator
MNVEAANSPVILVLEDSGLMAMEIDAALNDAGYRTIIVSTVANASDAVRSMDIDAALLDFRLEDGDCTPIALALEQQDVPTAIISGYDAEILSPELARFPVFRKPIGAAHLVEWVDSTLAQDNSGFATGTKSG